MSFTPPHAIRRYASLIFPIQQALARMIKMASLWPTILITMVFVASNPKDAISMQPSSVFNLPSQGPQPQIRVKTIMPIDTNWNATARRLTKLPSDEVKTGPILKKSHVCEKISELLKDCDSDVCQTGERVPKFLQLLSELNYYVDKTLLVEKFLLIESAPISFTAPSGFGKSLNQYLLQAFFQVPVAVNGTKIPKEQSVTYKAFKLLKIGKSKCFEEHFGTRGVIYYDFQGLTSFRNADQITEQLNNAFLSSVKNDHPFVCHLNDFGFKPFCEECLQFSGPMTSAHINFCSCEIGRILKGFYGRAPLILVDEYSTPFQYALSKGGKRLSETALRQSVSVPVTFIASSAKEHYGDIFWQVYSTGIMQYGELYNYHANNLKFKSVFSDATLSEFYGFTPSDIKDIVEHYRLDKDQEKHISDYFDGYYVYYGTQSKTRLYCSGAVIRYVEEGCKELGKTELDGYFNGHPLGGFQGLLAMHRLGSMVLDTLKPAATIFIMVVKRFTPREIIDLREAEISTATANEKHLTEVEHYFFSYLMEHGLYTGKKKRDFYLLSVPNKMARAAIERAILRKENFKAIFQCTEIEERNYYNSLQKLGGTNESLVYFTRSVTKLFVHPSYQKPTEELEFELAAPMYTLLIGQECNLDAQLYMPLSKDTSKRKFVDIYYKRQDNTVIVIETRRPSKRSKTWSTSVRAVEDILERNYTRLVDVPGLRAFILLGVYMNDTISQCSILYNTTNTANMMTYTIAFESQKKQKGNTNLNIK